MISLNCVQAMRRPGSPNISSTHSSANADALGRCAEQNSRKKLRPSGRTNSAEYSAGFSHNSLSRTAGTTLKTQGTTTFLGDESIYPLNFPRFKMAQLL